MRTFLINGVAHTEIDCRCNSFYTCPVCGGKMHEQRVTVPPAKHDCTWKYACAKCDKIEWEDAD